MVEHGANNAKIVGLICNELNMHKLIKMYTFNAVQVSLVKASAKCINVNTCFMSVSQLLYEAAFNNEICGLN